MNVAVIRYSEQIEKWQVLWSWTSGEPKEFERAQSAIDWCNEHGYLISWK